MPIGDLSEKCKVLDSLLGASHSSAMPTSHDAALFTGNPYAGGVETDYASYARVTVSNNATWPAADPTTGLKTTVVAFPDATGPASNDIRCWVLFDGSAIFAWDFLATSLTIDGPGVLDTVGITVYIPDNANV